MGKNLIKIVLLLFTVWGLMFFVFYNSSNPIRVKNKIYPINNSKLSKEVSYIFKEVEFRGYLFNKDSVEIWYINKEKQEHFFTFRLSAKLLTKLKKENPYLCKKDDNFIYTKYFKLRVSKDFINRNLFCINEDKEFFILTQLNEKGLEDALVVYVKME